MGWEIVTTKLSNARDEVQAAINHVTANYGRGFDNDDMLELVGLRSQIEAKLDWATEMEKNSM